MAARIPSALEEEMRRRLGGTPFRDGFVAVRSSGTDEDSSAHSFAGGLVDLLEWVGWLVSWSGLAGWSLGVVVRPE